MDNTSVLHGLKEVGVEIVNLKSCFDYQEKRLDEMEEIINRITEEDMRAGRKPHRCPICNGTAYDAENMLCLPCDGAGIVWG